MKEASGNVAGAPGNRLYWKQTYIERATLSVYYHRQPHVVCDNIKPADLPSLQDLYTVYVMKHAILYIIYSFIYLILEQCN